MIGEKDALTFGVPLVAASIGVLGTWLVAENAKKKTPADVAKVIADAFQALLEEVQAQNKILREQVVELQRDNVVRRATGHENANKIMVLEGKLNLLLRHAFSLENCLREAGLTVPERPLGL